MQNAERRASIEIAACCLRVAAVRPGILISLVLALAAACGPPGGPIVVLPGSVAPVTAAAPAVRRLQRDLTEIFGNTDKPILWAVSVRSLASGDSLYRLNDTLLVMPASNVKIATLAAAAERLGWASRYETTLLATGPIENGTLRGDLIVRGGGDPTTQGRAADTPSTFETWALELKARGITRLEGRIVGDDDAFDDERPGAGWSWDDLDLGFAAPASALQMHENVADLTIRPALRAGEPGQLDLFPPHSGLLVANQVTTGPPDTPLALQFHRLPGERLLAVSGTIPRDGQPFLRTVAVPNPTEFFVLNLRDSLAAAGLDVTGEAVDVDALEAEAEPRIGDTAAPPTVLITHHSPPLVELAAVMMKYSQNLYAETLLRRLSDEGTVEAGLSALGDVLAGWGIERDDAIIVDGSGLSRYNYMTAAAIVEILTRMHGAQNHAEPFRAALPLAGRDGTMVARLKGTAAEGRVWAKTGSVANVRALSGYATTRNGEPLAFAIIANNFSVGGDEADRLIDWAVERLASFRRE